MKIPNNLAQMAQTPNGTMPQMGQIVRPQKSSSTNETTEQASNRTETLTTDIIPSAVQHIVSLYHNFDAFSNIS